MGFVIGVLVKEGIRSDALHQAFLSSAALSRRFRQFQLQILLGQTDCIICEYGKYW